MIFMQACLKLYKKLNHKIFDFFFLNVGWINYDFFKWQKFNIKVTKIRTLKSLFLKIAILWYIFKIIYILHMNEM
jgi:hypothetical protein